MIQKLSLSLLSLACVALCFAITECATRYALSDMERFSVWRFRFSDTTGWSYRPGETYDLRGPTGGALLYRDGAWRRPILMSINDAGYRGKVYPERKPAGITRVVMLGDSSTFGPSVSDDSTFSALLDSRFAEVETINLGVEGFGPAQSLIQLEKHGLAYTPDLVIFTLCWENDFADSLKDFNEGHPKPYFEPQGTDGVLRTQHLQQGFRPIFMSLRSQLLSLALLHAWAFPGWDGDPSDAWLTERSDNDEIFQLGRASTLGAIRRMHRVAREADARFAVMLHPTSRRGLENQAKRYTFSHDLTNMGVDSYTTLPYFVEQGLSEDNFFDYFMDFSCHFQKLGHEIAADFIAEKVLYAPGSPLRPK